MPLSTYDCDCKISTFLLYFIFCIETTIERSAFYIDILEHQHGNLKNRRLSMNACFSLMPRMEATLPYLSSLHYIRKK